MTDTMTDATPRGRINALLAQQHELSRDDSPAAREAYVRNGVEILRLTTVADLSSEWKPSAMLLGTRPVREQINDAEGIAKAKRKLADLEATRDRLQSLKPHQRNGEEDRLGAIYSEINNLRIEIVMAERMHGGAAA